MTKETFVELMKDTYAEQGLAAMTAYEAELAWLEFCQEDRSMSGYRELSLQSKAQL